MQELMDKENNNMMPLNDTSVKTEEEKINPAHSGIRKKLRIIGPVMLIIWPTVLRKVSKLWAKPLAKACLPVLRPGE
jgi:hypothetical protein